MNASIKFCDNCGATNRSNAKFCYACGQPQMVYASTATGLLTSAYQLKQRYRIVEKLGQGGFGAIYKVEDMLFNNATRAAKEMGMRGLNTQEVQSAIVAFRNEAQLLASLSHSNLPHIYDHFEEHDIFDNKNTALIITTQSNPLLLRCQLHGNSYYGVEVRQEGKGSLQECSIYENAYDNVLIATGSTPYFYLCKIHNGKGTVEYCEIYAHRSANISISSGADPLISNCKISRSQQSGIHVYDDGRGTITNCAITENTYGALDIAPECRVVLKGNQL